MRYNIIRGLAYLSQYADKYYLLNIFKDYAKNKTYFEIYDRVNDKIKKVVVRKNGHFRINNETLSYDINFIFKN